MRPETTPAVGSVAEIDRGAHDVVDEVVLVESAGGRSVATSAVATAAIDGRSIVSTMTWRAARAEGRRAQSVS